MSRLLFRWLILTLSFWMLPHLVAGIYVDGFGAALAAAAILGALNVVVRPLLIFLTLPFTFLTLGLFLFVVNALVFQFVGFFVSGFEVRSFGSALLGSILVSLVSWVFDLSVKKREGRFRVEVHRRGGPQVIDLESRDKTRWE